MYNSVLNNVHFYDYARCMTLSDRNVIFKAGIILSFLFLLICIAASIKAIPVYPLMETEITHRPEGMFLAFMEKFFDAKLLAVHCGILVLVLYSFLTIILNYYFFEKTKSPEILFVIFFAASFSIEALRLILPLGRVYDFPSLYALAATRVIFFGRFFGVFSLFTASIYGAGYEMQRQRYVIIIITVTSLLIAMGIPIDTQAWDSGLNMVIGYTGMFRLIEAGTFLITAISFFIAAWSRGPRGYIFIGAGSALVFLGRNILLNADTWAGLPLGLPLLAVGTWLICTNLHRIYLWL
jgi:hypothetical protein